MTSTTTTQTAATTPDAVAFSLAGRFLEALARQDFDGIRATLGDDVDLVALVPSGCREWAGPADVASRFEAWFGDTERFHLADAAVGEVGGRLLVRWQIRLQAQRLGPGWRVVEQHVFVDTEGAGADERISRLSLLCSGYRPDSGRD